MYQYIKDIGTWVTTETIKRLSDKTFIPLDPANTDYQRFKIDLTNGAELQDANNNVMTANQVSQFLATLP